MRKTLIILVTVALLGCASTTKLPYKSMAMTKAAAEAIMGTAVDLYVQEEISKENYLKIRDVYEKSRKANDAVINAMQLSLDLGRTPEESPDYVSALNEFRSLLQHLLDLAVEFKLIGEV